MTEERRSTSEFWRKLLDIDARKETISKNADRPRKPLRRVFWALFDLMTKFYWRITVKGVENIPRSSPFIVAPNHQSSLDFPCVAWALGERWRKDLFSVATKHFYDNPFARFFMKMAANIERIDTVDDFIPALKVAARILKSGKPFYINPEGTRSKTGELLPFRPGVGVLACELNVPIYPVYINGTNKCFPPGNIFPKPGRIEISFGKPIYMDEYRGKLKVAENAYFVFKEVTDELRRRVSDLQNSPAL